jgi:hypothetical protein
MWVPVCAEVITLDWQPKYPSYKEGLKEIFREIREEKIFF